MSASEIPGATIAWLVEPLNPICRKVFGKYEAESRRLIDKGLVLPAYDYTLKCSHAFNLLDARGVISVTERARFIGRVRDLARRVAQAYVAQREAMGHPLLGRLAGAGRA